MMRAPLVRTPALVVLALACAAVLPASASAASDQLYYGRTSQRQAVALDVRNGRTAGHGGKPVFQPRQLLMLRAGIEAPLPAGVPFRHGAVRYHRVLHSRSIRSEIWFRARRTKGGREITGSYRGVTSSPGYRRIDSHTVRFTATLWAASTGAAWTGATTEGRTLALSLLVLPSPERRPRYAVRVPALQQTLRCTRADGRPFITTVATSGLRADLAPVGSLVPPVGGAYQFTAGLRTAPDHPGHASVQTPDGVAVDVNLAVTSLRWKGGGLRATGSVSFATGDGGCAPATSTFTARPR